jgi:DNA-binding CsgD family transcriptional regulator
MNPGTRLLIAAEREELELLAADCTLEELGDVFGLTRERVRQILVKRGVTTRRQSALHARQRAEVLRLAPDHTSGQIAAMLGLSTRRVSQLVGPGVCLREPPKWPRRVVVQRIQEFVARYGVTPGARDWNPAMAIADGRSDLADRFHRDGCWPYATIVLQRFGTWNGAIKAAGFEPRAPGIKRADVRRSVA